MRLLELLFGETSPTTSQLLAIESPVVLMGRGHSGTRVLSWICAHLGINLGADEDSKAGDVSDESFQHEIKIIALKSLEITRTDQVKPAEVRRFQRAVYRYYAGLGKPAGLWGWKFPETYLIGPSVAAACPRARFIHILRDGRDIAFKQHLTDNPAKKLGRAVLKKTNGLERRRHLQAALSWAFQVDHFEKFRESLPTNRVFNLTFEQLCQRPEKVVTELCGFLKVSMTESCRHYIAEEINSGKVAQYRESDPRLVKEVEAEIGPTLTRYGYAS